ncbi:hypothetical protein BD410DRAFT_780167 [Rickenella mellea]|uniref:Uncharacterized protein n=1 Tax=Rickenella mellea TaxID=50990 RepID=A0A4R5XEW4_9AGAM|nr:hypothetical protein BD410DRAFT_780167 [Rickenella mellea]
MDDDFGFGASVWSTPAESSTSTVKPAGLIPSFAPPQSLDDPLDDFGAIPQEFANEDDFGDFGDFGDVSNVEEIATFDDTQDDVGYPSQQWQSLHLDPFPTSRELKGQLDLLLAPLWASSEDSQYLTDEDIRQVQGLGQILITPESRNLFNTLFQSSPPNLVPPNWTRSRIRRQHLTSLGIPVNLDEVLPHSNAKPLPALQITTRPSSAPPGPRHTAQASKGQPGSGNNSRAGTPKPSSPVKQSAANQLSLGPKPELDQGRISQVLALTSENLTLLPLPTLEAHLNSVRSLTANTTTLLTHLLQTRDALQQDSETYNGLIAELVGEAQKMKTGPKTRTGAGKRGSGFT